MSYNPNLHASPDVDTETREHVVVNPNVVDVHAGNPAGTHSQAGWISSLFLDIEAERKILDLGCYAIIAAACVVYIILNFLPSAYGRYASRAFGILIPSRLAWILQDLPAVVIPLLVFFNMEHTQLHASNYILLGVFILSYVQRTLVYPLMIKGGKPVPSLHFLVALGYNALNGYFQARYLTRFAYYGPLWLVSPNFLCGMLMFLMGWGINLHSDAILRNLRSSKGKGDVMATANKAETVAKVFDRDMGVDAAGPGGPMPSAHHSISQSAVGDSDTAGYFIPYGGMFEFVSCANFFGEIVEWWGFAFACWSLPALAHAIFTTANLVPRALQHHQDYLNKFREDYPKSRYAVIPYVL